MKIARIRNHEDQDAEIMKIDDIINEMETMEFDD